MKKIFLAALLIALVANPALAIVAGSRHDMIASGFAVPSGGASAEICIFCHTPHNAQATAGPSPLWNNTAAASVDATVYTSATTNFVATQATVNATDALLCLSCHDSGVGMPVNMPNVGSIDPTAAVMDANALLGTDLSNDHPIGMDLGADPQLADPYIKSILTITGAMGSENPFYGVNNTMWCSSCHDVHEDANIPFLRIPNTGSALCKACHAQ